VNRRFAFPSQQSGAGSAFRLSSMNETASNSLTAKKEVGAVDRRVTQSAALTGKSPSEFVDASDIRPCGTGGKFAT
jgi:hypothetical protein